MYTAKVLNVQVKLNSLECDIHLGFESQTVRQRKHHSTLIAESIASKTHRQHVP